MAQSHYNRSEIISYFELTDKQKQDVLDCYYQDEKEAEEDRFVIFEGNNTKPEFHAALPLSQFIRTSKPNIWDGIFGTSYFSAYFIKISKCGSEALIAERFC